jgi:hypothetical protein
MALVTLPYVIWPRDDLRPAHVTFSPVPFTRGGGLSLGGVERVVRTDRGYWRAELKGIPIHEETRRRIFHRVRTDLNGRAGLVVVPAYAEDSSPWASGIAEDAAVTEFTDGTRFTDGTGFRERAIDVRMGSTAPIGATVVTLRVIRGTAPSGVRFSYHHALYETGSILEQLDEDTFRVTVFPALREGIGKGAYLEFDRPTCLCHLADDRGMELPSGIAKLYRVDVGFVEATDYWNDRARNPYPVVTYALPEGEAEYLAWDNGDGNEELLIWDGGSGTELLTSGF